MERRDDYKLLEISDSLTCINQKVSFFGVIVELNFPRRSKGTDWCCSLKLVDQSYPKGVIVNVFAETAVGLPRVQALGDIIQFHHVTVKLHNEEVNAVFNKKFSAFALYGQQDGHGSDPYQYSERFHMRELDPNFVVSLRKWLVDFQFEEGFANRFSFLREIKESDQANLVCKILHVCEYVKNEWMALVWDGTDCPPNTAKSILEDGKDNPMPLTLEPVPLARDLLCTFPTVGSILRVMIEKGSETHATRLLNAGKWVKLFNVSIEVQSGLWYGRLTPAVKLQYTPDNDRFASACTRIHKERLTRGSVPYSGLPWCSRITEVNQDDVALVSLMGIITSAKVTAKFRCIARVMAMCPWQVEDFRSPRGIYRIRMTIEDPTARIHAYVYAEDGERLFGVCSSLELLSRKRDELLGITMSEDGERLEASRNPPWIELCIKSYYLDKIDPWGTRNYRICNTKVVV